MGEFFNNIGEFLDILHIVRNQRHDPHVQRIELKGSTVSGKGSASNDWDIATREGLQPLI